MARRAVRWLTLGLLISIAALGQGTAVPVSSRQADPSTAIPPTTWSTPGSRASGSGADRLGREARDDAMGELTQGEAAKLDASLHAAYEAVRKVGSASTWSSGRPLARPLSVPEWLADREPLWGPVPQVVTSGASRIRVIVIRSGRGLAGASPGRPERTSPLVEPTVVRVDELDDLVRSSDVVAVRVPSQYLPANDQAVADARVPEVRQSHGLTGRGVIVGVIDTGIDIFHPAFVAGDGRTRIVALLDLADPGDVDGDGSLDGVGPAGGTLYSRDDIDRALVNPGHVIRWPEPPMRIPDDGVLHAELVVSEETSIDSLYVQVHLRHPYLDDLRLSLVSPDGRRFLLLDAADASATTLQATYGPLDLGGTRAFGRWVLEIEDRAPDDIGTLLSWALHINRPVRQQDLDGHGTHVAGTAAGDDEEGGMVKTGRYAGVAPEADIVVVRGTRSLAGLADDDVIGALRWLDGLAAERLQPYVVNMSFGTHYGAHDGTDPIELVVDDLSGPGRSGAVFVVAAGNEGDVPMHAGGWFSSAANGVELAIPPGDPFEFIDVWFEGNAATRVGVEYPEGQGINCVSTDMSGGDMLADCGRVAALQPVGTSARRLLITRTEPTGPRVVNIVQLTMSAPRSAGDPHRLTALLHQNSAGQALLDGTWWLRFHDTDGPWNAWSLLGLPFAHGDTSMTVAMPATARQALAVGAHVTRMEWQSEAGEVIEYPAADELGALAEFSSRGPTRDGRVKPDLTAPGAVLISARSGDMSPSYLGYPERALVSPLHVASVGTSMSAPVVAGAVALLLETNHHLDSAEVRSILAAGARLDRFTGDPPQSASWGVGKLDLVRTIERLPYRPVTVTPSPTPDASATPTASVTPARPTPTGSPTSCPGQSSVSFVTDRDNEDNARTGRADGDMARMDTSQPACIFRPNSVHPIEFNIVVDRVPEGSAEAWLTIRSYDVDEQAQDCPERDAVSFNGHQVGLLTGADDVWSTSGPYRIDPAWVKAGNNLVEIEVNTLRCPDASGTADMAWCVGIGRGELQLGAGGGAATVRAVGTPQGCWLAGVVHRVSVEVDSTLAEQEVRVEINLVDANNVTLLGQSRTAVVHGASTDPFEFDVAIAGSVAPGPYQLRVFVYDTCSESLQQMVVRDVEIGCRGGRLFLPAASTAGKLPFPDPDLADKIWRAIERYVQERPVERVYPAYRSAPTRDGARRNVESGCWDFPDLPALFGEGAHHRACYSWLANYLALYHAVRAQRLASANDLAWARAYFDVADDYLRMMAFGPESNPGGEGHRDTLAAMWQNPQRAVDVAVVAELLRQQDALPLARRLRHQDVLSGIARAWYVGIHETGIHPSSGVSLTVRTAPTHAASSLEGHPSLSRVPWTFNWDADKGNTPAEEVAWMGASAMLAARQLRGRLDATEASAMYEAGRHYVDFALVFGRPDPVHGGTIRTLNAETRGGPYGQRRYWIENLEPDVPSVPHIGITWRYLLTALFASDQPRQRPWLSLVPDDEQWQVLLRSAGETLRAPDGTFLIDMTPGSGFGYNMADHAEWVMPCGHYQPGRQYVRYDGRLGAPPMFLSNVGYPGGLDIIAAAWPLMRVAGARADHGSYHVWRGRLDAVLDEYIDRPPDPATAACNVTPFVSSNLGYHWARMLLDYLAAYLGASGFTVEEWRR